MKLRQLLLSFLALFASITANAYDAYINGIYYKFSGNEAEVTYNNDYPYLYSGTKVIPTSVTYSGKTYSVTSIGYLAFGNCSGLTSVTIPNSVTRIGKSAFYNCSGLTSITIPNSVTSIGLEAFYDCSRLAYVTIGNSVTSIGERAFAVCSSLIYVSIPNSVTSIGDYAFSGCSGLTSVTIPNSVTSIGVCAFRNCSSLTSVTIGNGVTSIGYAAFGACSSLTSVTSLATTPPHIISTGINAPFAYISSKCVLTIPAGTRNAYISAGWTTSVFQGGIVEDGASEPNISFADANVKSLCVANWDTNGDGELSEAEAAAVTSLGEVFRGKTTITSFNELKYFTGLTSIGNSAFYKCSGLTSVTIPNSVTSIGNSAFYNCSGLTSVTIPNSVTSIEESAFARCSGLTSVTIPNSVTRIGNTAFSQCISLTSITIPGSVTSIGSRAFIETGWYNAQPDGILYLDNWLLGYKGTEPTGNVTIKNGTKWIADWAFSSCSGLISITIPNSVTSIGRGAFADCSGLTAINIPNSVTSIGNYAFYNCGSLTSVVSKIQKPFAFGSNAFANISSNCVLTVPAGTRNAYISAGWTENFFRGGIVEAAAPSPNITFADANVKALCVANWDTNGDGELSEEESAAVTSLGEVFKENTAITSFNELQYFTGLTSIGKLAFCGCENLTSVTIPESVTSIGDYAFSGCSGLTSITIPNSVTSIGEAAFSGCSGLTSIIVESGNMVYDSRNNCNAIIATATNTLITGCINTIIPNSVTSIGDWAFSDCSLTSVTIPNSVTSIGDYAFLNCTGLTSITIPNSVTSIGDGTFSGCSGLTSVTIPNSVTSIGNYAFSNCSGLTSVTIGNSVTSIGESAFRGCSGLTSVTIPNSVTSIGEAAFYGCSGLTSVTIGNSVTSIGERAFRNCESLTSVVSHIQKPFAFGYSAFSDISSNCVLTVPAGTRNAYISAGWTENIFKGGIVEDGASSGIRGDVNGDGNVSITDVVMIIDVIAGTITDASQKAAADVNDDGNVSITDCVAAIDLIAAQSSSQSSVRKKSHAMLSSTDFISAALKDNLLTISLDNEKRYTAFQMIVNMPDGMTLGRVSMDEMRGASHQVVVRNLAGGQYLVAGYSANNDEFIGNNGSLFSIVTDGQAEGDIFISDIEFATTQAEAYYLADITLSSTPTIINEIKYEELRMKDEIYDLQGRRVVTPSKGVYIYNGKKAVIK